MGESTRERILNLIGVCLLAACFVLSLGRIAIAAYKNRAGEDGQGVVTVRFAHWQLESGVREALDEVAAEYMKLNPRVRVVQIPVPERIYPNWLITQLVGGTAPDIIALGIGITDERRARFFLPMSDLVDLPNPWNAGTELEGVPLRETFFDGMESCFSPTLLEYYGVPISSYSVRMYYNLDILREVTGSEDLPSTYEELVALAEKIVAYSQRTGRQIFPIAGSKYNAPYIMNRLIASQTEDLGNRLAIDFHGNRPSATLLARAYARGEWTVDEPEIKAGLQIMRELGRYMQPGFLQLGRDDASFYFVQGRAAMISTGSWDATSITSQADFPVAVGYIPVPQPGFEQAPFSRGVASDTSAVAGVIMGLTRQTKNPEAALDFLYFMSSQPMNQLFTDVSKWPPSVVGVVPHEQAAIFQPFLDGYLGGFNLEFTGADARRLYNTGFNRLVSPVGSVDAFLDTIRPNYLDALHRDLVRTVRDSTANAQRSGTTLGALAWLAVQNPDDRITATKLDMLSQSFAATDMAVRRARQAQAELAEALK